MSLFIPDPLMITLCLKVTFFIKKTIAAPDITMTAAGPAEVIYKLQAPLRACIGFVIALLLASPAIAAADGLTVKSKWDENLLNVRLPEVRITSDTMTGAWQGITTGYKIRVNLYQDAISSGDKMVFENANKGRPSLFLFSCKGVSSQNVFLRQVIQDDVHRSADARGWRLTSIRRASPLFDLFQAGIVPPGAQAIPPGFGVRQPSGALKSARLRQSGGGPPHSRTLREVISTV
jgi:hypothetical protein